MHTDTEIFRALWIAGTFAECVIVCTIIARRIWGRWPSLVTFCLGSLTVDVVLAFSPRTSWTHYYAYWIWIAVSAVVRVWILADVVSSIPGAEIVPRRVRLVIFSVATATSIGSWFIASQDLSAHHSTLRSAGALLDTALSFASCAFLAVALPAIWLLRLSWSRRGAIIAAGLCVKGFGALICTYLVATGTPDIRHAAMLAGAAVSFLTIAIWTAGMATSEFTYSPSLPQSVTTVKVDSPCIF